MKVSVWKLRTCEVVESHRILKDCSPLAVPYLCGKGGNYPRKRHNCQRNIFIKAWLNNLWQKIIPTKWSNSERDTHTRSPLQCNASMSQDTSGLICFSPNKWVCQLSWHMKEQRLWLIHDSLCAQWTQWSCLILLPYHARIIVAWWNLCQKCFSYRLLRLSLFFTDSFPSVQKVTKTQVIRSSSWVEEDSIFFKKARMRDLTLPYFRGVS